MKITIDRLKEIIKEEIEAAEQPDKLSGFTKGATQKSKTNIDKSSVDNALQAVAAEIQKQNSIQGKAKIVGLLMQKIGLTADDLYKVTQTLRQKD